MQTKKSQKPVFKFEEVLKSLIEENNLQVNLNTPSNQPFDPSKATLEELQKKNEEDIELSNSIIEKIKKGEGSLEDYTTLERIASELSSIEQAKANLTNSTQNLGTGSNTTKPNRIPKQTPQNNNIVSPL